MTELFSINKILRGRDILWEIKSVSCWHKKVALGSLPGLLRSYAPKYRRTMHMAWVLSAHCPALSLSLWATFCFFVCRRWASGACSRAAGADLGPCSVLQRAAAGFHTALCYVTCPLSPACMELGHCSSAHIVIMGTLGVMIWEVIIYCRCGGYWTGKIQRHYS